MTGASQIRAAPTRGSARPRRPRTLPRLNLALAITAVGLLIASGPLLLGIQNRPLRVVPLVAHVTGLLAGYCVLVLLVLVSRTPALERRLGADVLTRWHARGASLTLVLILAHAWAATMAWAQVTRVSFLAGFWDILAIPGIPAATVATAIMLALAALSIRGVRRLLRHERWHGLHFLMYVAVALGFAHQLAGPDLAGHRLLQIAWALAYSYVFALLVRHRFVTPMRQAARHRMRVAAVDEEGPGVVSITVAGQHLDELAAESGQFFRWRFLTPDHWIAAHPFSLSAPATETALRLTVKALGDGSRGLQNVAVGTWVLAEGPYGAITSARRTHRDVLLIAGGVGITPMRALFETIPLAPGDDLLLLYRAASERDLLFRDELDAIASGRGARVTYVLGKDRQALSAPSLRAAVPNLAERDVYLCGPPSLTSALRKALRAAGLPPGQLHEERFSF